MFTRARMGLLMIVLLSALWLAAETLDGDIDGYADAEPLGTGDGFVYSSECNIPTDGTDASPAIETCADRVSNGQGGGTIFFTRGTYTLATPVDINSGQRAEVAFEGFGNGTYGSPTFNVTGPTGFLIGQGTSNYIQCPRWTNLRFNLQGGSQKVFEANSTKRCNFENIQITAPDSADSTVGIELDSQQRTGNGALDASYGYIDNLECYGLHVCLDAVDRGGFDMSGGHIAARA